MKLLSCPMDVLHFDYMLWQKVVWVQLTLGFSTVDFPAQTPFLPSFCDTLSLLTWLHLCENLPEQLNPATSTRYPVSEPEGMLCLVLTRLISKDIKDD